MSSLKKTNIDIVNLDTWNRIKQSKNELNLSTISDFLFMAINDYFDEKVKMKLLLKNLEKYYEYIHYDMNMIKEKMNLDTDIIIKLIDTYIDRKIPLFGTEMLADNRKNRKIIHDLMISNDILPRELSIAYNLRKYMELNHIDLLNVKEIQKEKLTIANKILLEMFYPNKEERRLEIYNLAVELASILINYEDKTEIIKCIACTKECIFKDPVYIYYKSGIEMNLDDLQEDLVSDILKSKFLEKYMVYYGIVLTLAIQKIIEHNFYEVKQFIDNEISLFKEPKKIIILIDKMMLFNKEQMMAELEKHIDIEKFWSGTGAQNSRLVKIINQ